MSRLFCKKAKKRVELGVYDWEKSHIMTSALNNKIRFTNQPCYLNRDE